MTTRASQRRDHWNRVYTSRLPTEVSWFQQQPETSLALIRQSRIERTAGLIDVGAGASRLAGQLLDAGYGPVTVLDVSAAALDHLRTELGERSGRVELVEADVTAFEPQRHYGLWHDRAVFHFLTDPADRRAYVRVLRAALAARGAVIIAAFALDGPPRCSGLEVVRYDAASLAGELGPGFELLESRPEVHVTPGGAEQRFEYHLFRLS